MIFGRLLTKNNVFITILVMFIFLLASCSSSPKYTSHSAVTPIPSHSKHKRIIQVAKSQLGRPYRYGGLTPKTGFDCSGLINYSYKKVGLTLPRTTRQLYRMSKPIKRKHLRRGDLVFFRINRKSISHVGLYLGNNKFIHAPSSGKRVNIASLNTKYWRARFARGGRI